MPSFLKRLSFFCFTISIFFLLSSKALASDTGWVITSFHADITINQDAKELLILKKLASFILSWESLSPEQVFLLLPK